MDEASSPKEKFLAIVTGAAQRLGRAFAVSLSQRGYAIGLHYYQSEKKALELAGELKSRQIPVVLLHADLRQPHQIDEMLRKVDEAGFTPKVLINSAAEMVHKSITEISLEEWDDQFALNLRATWYLSTQLSKRMTSGGVIINISDVGATKAWSGFGAYSITKAGVNSLTQLMARALAPQIRVCAIAPGLVLPPEDMPRDKWNQLLEKTPQKKPVSIQSITQAMEFLMDNDYITGDILTIDGGRQLV